MMAYVVVEDDAGSMEMLAFSSALKQYDALLQENTPVVITGRLSVREEKEPQMVINDVQSLLDYDGAVRRPQRAVRQVPDGQRLYLRVEQEDSVSFRKTRAILNMFPGNQYVILLAADTGNRYGTKCQPDEGMLAELRSLLGEKNVVMK